MIWTSFLTLGADAGIRPEEWALYWPLALGLLLGAFIGLEREWSQSESGQYWAGIRTFPFIALLGGLAALIETKVQVEWFYSAAFVVFTLFIIASYVVTSRGDRSTGATTEVTALLVFIIGSMAVWEFQFLAATLAIVVTAILASKRYLHVLAHRADGEEISSTLKLLVITVIVLPLLPRHGFGTEIVQYLGYDPVLNANLVQVFDVLNPHYIWLMVTLISGISFTGYFLIKRYGAKRGLTVLSALGGMVSSSAVAVTLASRSKENPDTESAKRFSMGMMLATGAMFLRLLFAVFVIDGDPNRTLTKILAVPLFVMATVSLIIAVVFYRTGSKEEAAEISLRNPVSLQSALKFGALFAFILLVTKAVSVYLGTGYVYLVAAVSGLVSTSASALSLATDVGTEVGQMHINVAVVGILIAATASVLLKAYIGGFWGSTELRRYTVRTFGVLAFVGGVAAVITGVVLN